MKLNLGCGNDILEGYVNLDKYNLDGVDAVHDIEKLPLPFPDDHFDEIYAKDIIEHIDYIPVLKDLHRIMKPGGILTIKSPHYTSTNFWTDPTHKHAFAVRTFSFFAKNNPNFKYENRKYYFDFAFRRINKVRITFSKHFPHNWVMEKIVNMHPKIQMIYELTGWHTLFPAENVEVELMK